jgi:hypothetical protein
MCASQVAGITDVNHCSQLEFLNMSPNTGKRSKSNIRQHSQFRINMGLEAWNPQKENRAKTNLSGRKQQAGSTSWKSQLFFLNKT